ncbi:Septin-domain-containing protein [Phlebopus sp. FC_14]|nr:Septin-domain-containing protein [Phlebopus sp. FC_14]
MFSFRKRPRANSTGPPLKPSPSLPELKAQGIPWPENLVDVTALRETPQLAEHPQQGAVKNSLQSLDRAPILFHKPFRFLPGPQTDNVTSISALYMSQPPSAFDSWRSPSSAATNPTGRRAHRKNRTPPAFNLMVVGGRGTGKTSLLRLLLNTADISPNITDDQRAALSHFLKDGLKTTQTIDSACVEICESRYDRVLLTVIDTPGLDFSAGRELSVERQVTSFIKYLDTQYADTMNEESKVMRQSKGDQHVHLCIFMIDPTSIMCTNARRAKPSLPGRSVSETTISLPDAATIVPDLPDEEHSGDLSMSPAELRVIRRLSVRVNVLPVIARADSLTDETLSAVKAAVRKGLQEAGLDFGVFSSPKPTEEATTNGNGVHNENKNTSNDVYQNGDSHADTDAEDAKERPSRPVIRLKGARITRSRSRSRRDLASIAQDEREPQYPDDTDEQSVANVRFSAQTVSKTELDTLLPFALITPEAFHSPRLNQPRTDTPESRYSSFRADTIDTSTPVAETPTSPDSPIARKSAFFHTPPQNLRGVFTRKFRWGTVDVLNPEHCDFAALRTAILLTHMKVLKVYTREVLYEKYRTEKLLAKRATRSIGPEETKRLLEGVVLLYSQHGDAS